ncbi:MAG: prephenate/arogenate dehydrogenase family protein [Pseudomonadota bacterium]
MSPPLFDHVCVVGLGLIGSSLLRAMRAARLADRTTGFDLDPAIGTRALALDIVDEIAPSLRDAMAQADLVILATPVGAVDHLCAEISPHLKSGAIVSDVGSVKTGMVTAARHLPDDVFCVPAHPVAGTEQSGPEAGFADLFRDRWCILTPLPRDDAPYRAALSRVEQLWQAMGALTECMSADHHDLALAITSHLPHLIAFTLVGAADDLESVTEAEIVKYSAGGFRDFTRIAASDPVMWRDVFLQNKDAVLEVLGRFTEEVALLQRAIRWGDEETLTAAFTRGRALRRAIVDAGQETDAPNFGRDR